MSDESVSEYMFLNVVQSKWFSALILNMWPFNAIQYFSHPPAHSYEWGECVRVYVLTVVQSRRFRTPFLKMRSCNAILHLSHPPPPFYVWGECVRVYVFKGSSVQTAPHSNFQNVTPQRDTMFFASTSIVLWVRRRWQSICVGQSRRPRTPILKMWPCNAIPYLSHPPPPLYEWEECVSVYVF